MRLRRLIVDVDPSALARLLRFGARSEQARDIQPDVETNGVHELIVEYGNHPFQECAGVQFDPVTSEGFPSTPVREGLPKAFRMRHGRHYVEQLMGDAPLRTVREIAVADFHAVPDNEADLSDVAAVDRIGRRAAAAPRHAGRRALPRDRRAQPASGGDGGRPAGRAMPCARRARDGLESLRQAAATACRRAARRGDQSERDRSAGSRSVDVRRAISVAESSVLSPSMIAAAGDDRLRLAVLADLMGVELQRAETLAQGGGCSRQPHACRAVEQVTVGALAQPVVSPHQARSSPEERRSGRVVSDARATGFAADSRLMAIAFECMAQGILLLCARRDVEVAHRSRGRACAAGIDCGGLAEHRLDRRARGSRRFFDRDFGEHPSGAAGSAHGGVPARIARLHGGRAGLRGYRTRGCALTLVVPRPHGRLTPDR